MTWPSRTIAASVAFSGSSTSSSSSSGTGASAQFVPGPVPDRVGRLPIATGVCDRAAENDELERTRNDVPTKEFVAEVSVPSTGGDTDEPAFVQESGEESLEETKLDESVCLDPDDVDAKAWLDAGVVDWATHVVWMPPALFDEPYVFGLELKIWSTTL
jgi:hypothetical protein